jgi:hypothetical protein
MQALRRHQKEDERPQRFCLEKQNANVKPVKDMQGMISIRKTN